MKSVSQGCDLSQEYTNHSVRATAINLWSDADIPDRHITFVSGHSNEQSLARYSRTPQLQKFSDTISAALGNSNESLASLQPPFQPHNEQSRTVRASNMQTTTLATQNVVELATSSSSRNDFLAGFFNACSINSVQVYIGSQDR